MECVLLTTDPTLLLCAWPSFVFVFVFIPHSLLALCSFTQSLHHANALAPHFILLSNNISPTYLLCSPFLASRTTHNCLPRTATYNTVR
ncbi:hypothetical protein DFH06DRAFT_1213908 [Mycena polygramma]|nr:hypothetical protein DFH06DRAFT_1213908 [Mycena polygramma]